MKSLRITRFGQRITHAIVPVDKLQVAFVKWKDARGRERVAAGWMVADFPEGVAIAPEIRQPRGSETAAGDGYVVAVRSFWIEREAIADIIVMETPMDYEEKTGA